MYFLYALSSDGRCRGANAFVGAFRERRLALSQRAVERRRPNTKNIGYLVTDEPTDVSMSYRVMLRKAST